ncbi:MAG: MATE family efflux transporter [bacterium]
MANFQNTNTHFDRSIVEGPIMKAIWKLAWPTMLQNMIAGFQGIVDHTMVGHIVGYTGNAAIGVSWQIFLVVVVFISSLFSGMNVLVARFAGAGDADKVNRVVYQSFLASVILACGILAPAGYFLAPNLLDIVKAAPAVKAEALPYLRIMFVFSIGKLIFFMLGGALRTAGDAKTPLRLGVVMTVLNIIANIILIPILGTRGAAIGTVFATSSISIISLYWLFSGRLVVRFSKNMRWLPDWHIIGRLFKFGLPTGLQGIMVNVGGVMLLRFVGSLQQSAEAQAAFTVGYTQLFSFITWTSVGLMGATAAVAGQNLGAGKPERSSKTPKDAAKIGLTLASFIGLLFLMIPDKLYGIFGMNQPVVLGIGIELLKYLALSGLFITVALAFTGGLQGTGDTRSPMYISLVAQIVVPIGICAVTQAFWGLEAQDIWLAIVLGHFTRCALTFVRFNQGKWQYIKVEIREEKVRGGERVS